MVDPESSQLDTQRRRKPPDTWPTWGLSEGDEIAAGRSVIRLLGGGERTEVFLVYDRRLATDVAAKVLRPHKAARPAALKKLAREAEALGRLAHPSIVRGFGSALGGRYPHILMEYVEGPTLSDVLGWRGTLPVTEALIAGRQLAGALAQMAESGFVHLDVKTANIVMGRPAHWIDFGSARTLRRASLVRPTRRTSTFVAPERVASDHVQAPAGPASDVWALGVVMYRAIVGRRPFPRPSGSRKHPDITVRCPQLVADPAPAGANVPPAVERLLREMMATHPDERPAAADVAEEIERVLATRPRVSGGGRNRSPSRSARRNRGTNHSGMGLAHQPVPRRPCDRARGRHLILALLVALMTACLPVAISIAAGALGTDRADRLEGTGSVDVILGRGGNDLARGNAGNDRIDGGLGNDDLTGGAGDDRLLGGAGNDRLRGGHGLDRLYGGAGDDQLTAGPTPARATLGAIRPSGGDLVSGEAGDDTLRLRNGRADRLQCGAGRDVVTADALDIVVDATPADPNGTCEQVSRKSPPK